MGYEALPDSAQPRWRGLKAAGTLAGMVAFGVLASVHLNTAVKVTKL